MNTLVGFATVGRATTALDLLVFNLGLMAGLAAPWADVVSSLVILPLSFLGQRAAFRARGPLKGQAVWFALVTGVGVFGFQSLVLSAALEAVALVGLALANAAKGAAVAAGIRWNLYASPQIHAYGTSMTVSAARNLEPSKPGPTRRCSASLSTAPKQETRGATDYRSLNTAYPYFKGHPKHLRRIGAMVCSL